MALSNPPEKSLEPSKKPKFDAENLPNQNAKEAMMYSIRQGAIGGFYGFVGSMAFSLLANRYCKAESDWFKMDLTFIFLFHL